MSILQIEPVTLDGARFLILLYGGSQSGKTKTALFLAAGLEPDPNKRVLADLEGGRRGKLYKPDIPGGYLFAPMKPPFTPERGIEMLDQIEADPRGITVAVIDTCSHFWEGDGGILDIADSGTSNEARAKWKMPKRRLARFTNRLKQSSIHVILTARGRQSMYQAAGPDGKKVYGNSPMMPVYQHDLRYDMTVICEMQGEGRFSIEHDHWINPENQRKHHVGGKCPSMFRHLFKEETLSIETGTKLREWLGSQTNKTPAQKALERRAFDEAEGGKAAFSVFWKTLSNADQGLLTPIGADLKSIYTQADRDAEERRNTPTDDDDSGDQFPKTTGPAIEIEPSGDPVESDGAS